MTRGWTQVRFSLPRPGPVALLLFDPAGRARKRIELGRLSPGVHTVALNFSELPSGMYFLQLRTPGYQKVRRLILVR